MKARLYDINPSVLSAALIFLAALILRLRLDGPAAPGSIPGLRPGAA